MKKTNTILSAGMVLDGRYAILQFIGRGGMGKEYTNKRQTEA